MNGIDIRARSTTKVQGVGCHIGGASIVSVGSYVARAAPPSASEEARGTELPSVEAYSSVSIMVGGFVLRRRDSGAGLDAGQRYGIAQQTRQLYNSPLVPACVFLGLEAFETSQQKRARLSRAESADERACLPEADPRPVPAVETKRSVWRKYLVDLVASYEHPTLFQVCLCLRELTIILS